MKKIPLFVLSALFVLTAFSALSAQTPKKENISMSITPATTAVQLKQMMLDLRGQGLLMDVVSIDLTSDGLVHAISIEVTPENNAAEKQSYTTDDISKGNINIIRNYDATGKETQFCVGDCIDDPKK